MFRDGLLVLEVTWQVVALIPKGGGNYRGICLMEVVWKEVTVILNHRFTASITYHDYLHSFQVGFSIGTVTLEVKLIQQVLAMRYEFLHTILIDLHKVYEALDRSRCLGILEGYGVGIRALRLPCRYWEMLQMVAQEGGYYVKNFRGERSVIQGY